MIPLTQEQIDAAFAQAKSQEEYLLALFRLALPDFDLVERMEGRPAVHPETWKYVGRKAIAFDQKHHSDALPGGAWMDSGFASDSTVPPWSIDVSSVRIAYRTLIPLPDPEQQP